MSPYAQLPRPLRRSLVFGVPIALVTAIAVAATASGTSPAPSKPRAAAPEVVGTAVLDEIPLAKFSNSLIPNSVANDRGVHLGIGSDMFPADRKGEFWALTDRGPNGQIKVDGVKRRTFAVPEFNPAIVRVRVAGERVSVLRAIPITTASGKPVTGLPNQAARDEAPYNFNATTPWPSTPAVWTPRAWRGRRTAHSGSSTSTGPPSSMSPHAARC